MTRSTSRKFATIDLKGGDIVRFEGRKVEVFDTRPQGGSTRIQYILDNDIRSIDLPNDHKVTVYN